MVRAVERPEVDVAIIFAEIGATCSWPSPGATGSACAILRYMEIIDAEFNNGVLRPLRRPAAVTGSTRW